MSIPFAWSSAFSATREALSRGLLGLLALYRRALSPLLGGHCRFEPSCSKYAELCIRHHGPLRGLRLTAARLARCNPLTRGGVDLPPPVDGINFERSIDWDRIVAITNGENCSCKSGQHQSQALASSHPDRMRSNKTEVCARQKTPESAEFPRPHPLGPGSQSGASGRTLANAKPLTHSSIASAAHSSPRELGANCRG